MKTGRKPWIAMAALALSACASAPDAPPPFVAPDFTEITPSAAPARTILYTDCIAQAIERPAVARLAREEAELIRFTCTGAPAQRFYEALALMGGEAVSVWQADGRTFRATAKIQRDLFGADYCSSGPGGAVCQIVLNAGSFLTAAP
jgi:hypothetical protein